MIYLENNTEESLATSQWKDHIEKINILWVYASNCFPGTPVKNSVNELITHRAHYQSSTVFSHLVKIFEENRGFSLRKSEIDLGYFWSTFEARLENSWLKIQTHEKWWNEWQWFKKSIYFKKWIRCLSSINYLFCPQNMTKINRTNSHITHAPLKEPA